MSKQTISLRIDETHRSEIDRLAKVLDRDRSWLINEAISEFLANQRWQIEQIEAGKEDARQGRFASDDEVEDVFKRF